LTPIAIIVQSTLNDNRLRRLIAERVLKKAIRYIIQLTTTPKVLKGNKLASSKPEAQLLVTANDSMRLEAKLAARLKAIATKASP
jgi:hypothetical protein